MRTIQFCAGLLMAAAAFGQGGFSGPGMYEISNIKSGKVVDLDRNDQTTVIQFSSRGTDNQSWYIQDAGGGAYFIRNGMNGAALTAIGGNASPLQGHPFTGDPSQQWVIEDGKDGNAMIVSRNGKSLDIPDGTNRDGVRIQIYDRNGDSNQRFTFRLVQSNRQFRPGWLGGQGGQGGGGGPITCASDDGRRHYCDADTRGGVQLMRQISGSACVPNQTWGFDQRGIWVDRGCRAEFQAGNAGGAFGVGMPQGGGGGGGEIFSCSSDDGRRRYCRVNSRGPFVLTRQISGTACVQGETWGFDDRGIWVDRGCRAEFQAVRDRRDRDRRP